jgi:heat shock protein HslJ
MLNQSMTFKNAKTHLKTQNQPKTKTFPKLQSVVIDTSKETPNLNSSHNMKLFGIKINNFSGQNHCQRQPFLSTPESGDSPLSSHPKRIEK